MDRDVARESSFARGLAKLMAFGVIWFELGLFAILRFVVSCMRWVGWAMRVEEERLEDDLKFFQSLGSIVVLFISFKIYAAMYSEMGRFLQYPLARSPTLHPTEDTD